MKEFEKKRLQMINLKTSLVFEMEGRTNGRKERPRFE